MIKTIKRLAHDKKVPQPSRRPIKVLYSHINGFLCYFFNNLPFVLANFGKTFVRQTNSFQHLIQPNNWLLSLYASVRAKAAQPLHTSAIFG
jgi:hypothetical protein